MQVRTFYNRINYLLSIGTSTDGCTSPFKNYIHKYIKNSKLICQGHDFGGRGLIVGIKPGWDNNVMFLKANWFEGNFIWGIISFLFTLPYAVVRHNIGIPVNVYLFHIILILILTGYELDKHRLYLVSLLS